MERKMNRFIILCTFAISSIFCMNAIASDFQEALSDDYATELTGFVDIRYGMRTQEDEHEKSQSRNGYF